MAQFNWSNFDVGFLKAVIYSRKTKQDVHPLYPTDDADLLVPSMLAISPFPTRNFVITYRTEIEFDFLRTQPDLVLEMTGAPKKANFLTELNHLSQQEMTSSLADLYIKAMHKVGGGEFAYEQYSEFTQVRTVDLKKSSCKEEVSLYDFQKDAVAALKGHFIHEGAASGLLIMPTGSGKTRTSAAFLLQNMITSGYQVIWLTHRHLLIDQTAETFYQHSPVIKLFNSDIALFKMVCVSGQHQSIRATKRDDNLMILSVQSVSRNLPFLKTVLAKKVIIVVDESHHTSAPSYRKTIDYIRKIRKNAKLLGLTATPVRSTERESRDLLKMFDDKIVYSISMSELITKGILAEPVFERIKTGENFEAITSVDERRYIKRWGELPPSLVDKVAKSSARNQMIVEQYLTNRECYGKTLIFALNGYHALTLNEEFRKNDVNSDFIYANLGKETNTNVIKEFKSNDLDVLININILTEGSDIPDIQTVFLTRPTQSDVLLMQMIGRGMRGTAAGGTKRVNIVDFTDQWETFNKWLNPEWVIIGEPTAVDDPERKRRRKRDLIPFDLVRDLYNSLTFNKGRLWSYLSVPYGWYSLVGDDGEYYPVLVSEDQYPCYQRMIEEREILIKSGKPTVSALKKAYFGGFELPPRDMDVAVFWQNIRDIDAEPSFFTFEDREMVDPYNVARRIEEENLHWKHYPTEIFISSPLVQAVFGTVENYRSQVFEIGNRGHKKCMEPVVKELPASLIPLVIDRPYDLDELMQEVTDEMFEGSYEGIRGISWTTKPLKHYFGVYNSDDSIKINLVLNSSQIRKEVVKYVIYHEMLHRDYWYHDAEFREQEHKYPNYTECERFLDYKFGDYRLDDRGIK